METMAVFVAVGFWVAVGAGGSVPVGGTLVITGVGSWVWAGIEVRSWLTWVETWFGSGVPVGTATAAGGQE